MKLNKLFLGLLCMSAFTFVACSDDDDDYTPATVSGSQVFFSNSLQSQYEISPDANSFQVSISRGDAKGALSVPLTVTQSEGSIFTVPSSATFADGESEASILITYDPANIVYGDYATINIAIADESLTTDYGLSNYEFKAGVTAWVDYGTGYYREDIVSTWYSIGHPVYKVTIQRNTVAEGQYRLVNPYGASLGNALGDKDWEDEYYDSDNDYYLEIDASDPDAVYVKPTATGLTIDPESGMISTMSLVALYLNRGTPLETLKAEHPEYFGTLRNGIITMPARTMLISEENYNDGGWYYAASNGLFAVALPGSVIADYSLDVTYAGRFTDDSNNDYARLTFTFGDDVESVKFVVTDSDENADELVQGIQDGSLDDVHELTASGSTEVALETTGTYYVVAVIYAGGEAVGADVFDFKFKSSKDNAETWTAIYVGDYLYGANSYNQDGSFFYEDSPFTDEATLYVSDSDGTRYKIAPWCNSEEDGLIFTMDDETGTIVVDGADTGHDSSYGEIYATDFKTYGAADIESYYEDGVFHFFLAFNVPAGVFSYQEDTFTLTANAARIKAARKAGGKHHVKARLLRMSKLQRSSEVPLR